MEDKFLMNCSSWVTKLAKGGQGGIEDNYQFKGQNQSSDRKCSRFPVMVSKKRQLERLYYAKYVYLLPLQGSGGIHRSGEKGRIVTQIPVASLFMPSVGCYCVKEISWL